MANAKLGFIINCATAKDDVIRMKIEIFIYKNENYLQANVCKSRCRRIELPNSVQRSLPVESMLEPVEIIHMVTLTSTD